LLFYQLILASIVNGFLYAVMAIAFSIVVTVGNIWNFAQAGAISIAAFSIYTFYTTLSLPIWLSIIFAMIITGLLGFVIDRFAYQPLRERKSPVLIFFIVSLMLYTLIENILAIFFGTQTRTFSTKTEQMYDLGFITVTGWDIEVMIICTLLLIAFLSFMKLSKLGHALIAVATNPEMAETVGIKSKSIYSLSCVIAFVLIVPVTFLKGVHMGISASMGFDVLLVAIAATIVGGIGNFLGTIIAAFLISFIENLGIWKISTDWQHVIVFGVLFLFIVFRPQGLFGKKVG
jgi:branched-chain amino acid transport system permease protein